MKKYLLMAGALFSTWGYTQVEQPKDSLKMVELNEIVATGIYYKNYTAKESSKSLRVETPLLEQPQNIQVITIDALKDQQIIGLGNGVARNVSGVTRLEHWGDMYTRLNMRGNRAAAFINGTNVSTSWGPLSEDMSYVDRIEFVKGPAGFMLSNGEPSGLYNIVTKKPFFSNQPTGSVGVTMGSYNFYRAEADVNTKLNNKIAARLNVMGKNSKSFRPYDFNNRYVVNPSLKYKLSNKTTLTAEYIYQKAKMSQVGSFYLFPKNGYGIFPREATLNDPKISPTNIKEQYGNLNLQSWLSNNWKLTSQISFMTNRFMGNTMWPSKVTDDNKVIRNLGFWKANTDMKFGQAFLNGRLYTGNISHKILTGLDIADKTYLADWNQGADLDNEDNPYDVTKPYHPAEKGYPKYDDSKPLEEIGTPMGETYSSVYFQDEIGFLQDNLRLTLAMRYTDAKNNQYGKISKASKFTPRVGLSTTPIKSLSIYALYDEAFIPQLGLLRDDKEVQPITGDNYEIGIKKDWLNGKWNSTVSLYRIIKNNELITDPKNKPNEKYSIVKGQSIAKGVEMDVRGEVFEGMNLIMNYAFTDNSITKSNVPSLKVGDKVAGYAKHDFNTWLNYQIQKGEFKGFGASLGFTFLGDRFTWDAWGTKPNQAKLNDYRKWDAGLFWNNKNINIRLNVYNLTDEYLYSGSYYGYGDYYYYQAEAPRNYRLSVTYKF